MSSWNNISQYSVSSSTPSLVKLRALASVLDVGPEVSAPIVDAGPKVSVSGVVGHNIILL